MHQLEGRRRRAGGGELLAHVVLHGLDVVIDARLDALDGRGRAGVGRVGQLLARVRAPASARRAPGSCGSATARCSSHSASMRMRSRMSPASDEQLAQRRRDVAVAPIDRRERVER